MSLRRLTVAFVLSVFTASACAATSSKEQAAATMARAQALDLKCNFLNAYERDKLSKFTARAELALANSESMPATKATMQKGRAAGAAATCSPAEKAGVEQILANVMQATQPSNKVVKAPVTSAPVATDAQVARTSKVPAVASVENTKTPEAAASQTPAVPKVAKPVQVATTKPATTKKPASDLETYEKLTENYYLARRCGSGNVGGAYQAVVAEHGRVMANHSAAEVSAVLRRAETHAQGVSCS